MATAYLSQWVDEKTGAMQGAAKQHEFDIYIRPLIDTAKRLGVCNIVDYQADEAVAAKAFCNAVPHGHATFVLIPRAFDPQKDFLKATLRISHELRRAGRIDIVADAASIPSGSAEAILLSNILGCQGDLRNVHGVIQEANRILKAGGHAIVTSPNPMMGEFSSYTCSDVPESENCHGDSYKFQMKQGVEEQNAPGVYDNVFLTPNGLRHDFRAAGMIMESQTEICDQSWQGFASRHPAFIQQVFTKLAL